MGYTSLIKEVNIPELVKALRYCGKKYFAGNECKDCIRFGTGPLCDDKLKLDAAAAIEALQAEVEELKRVNVELLEDLPKYVKDELPKEKGWYYLVYLSKWNGKEWWVPPFPDYWTKPPQEEL